MSDQGWRPRGTLGAAAVALAVSLALAPGVAAKKRDFPRGFQWGVAIAGFQTEMGKGKNVDPNSDWFKWTHDAQNIADGTVTGDRPERGPGFFARYRRDVNLAAGRLRLKAFRLGIEWSRIFPTSTAGADSLQELNAIANKGAVRKYRAILRYIHRKGLTPWVTINHFTLPAWIHDPIAARDAFDAVGPDDPPPDGFGPRGWLDDETVTEFAKYSRFLAWKFGPLVNRWITLNEPMVVTVSGYVNLPSILQGNFPPGGYNFPAAIEVLINLADANAAAYAAVKSQDHKARVGVVHNMVAFTPANPSSPDDVAGTEHADYLFNRLFLDAAVRGYRDVNANGVIEPSERHPELANRADFIGVNYYFRGRVTGLGGSITPSIPILDFAPTTSYKSSINPGGGMCPTTCSEFGWEIFPSGFRQVLGTAGEYGRPVVVTENGISDANDDQRPGYLRSHLRALRATMRAKEAKVRGYFHWSLVDNFEWAVGYTQHFGLFKFNPKTLKRKPRGKSVRLFGRVARTGRLP